MRYRNEVGKTSEEPRYNGKEIMIKEVVDFFMRTDCELGHYTLYRNQWRSQRRRLQTALRFTRHDVTVNYEGLHESHAALLYDSMY